jgi:diphthamide biosynthesis protein 4
MSTERSKEPMNHYEVLHLPSPKDYLQYNSPKQLTDADIKRAYRAALLKHHPDKASSNAPHDAESQALENSSHAKVLGSSMKPSVDAIKHAYDVLSNVARRAEYDRELLLLHHHHHTMTEGDEKKTKPFRVGEELVDLDDLKLDEKGFWYRACRCGEEVSYVVTEEMLEDEAKKGGIEIVVGCAGCSLWIRVGFAVEDHGEGIGK